MLVEDALKEGDADGKLPTRIKRLVLSAADDIALRPNR